MHLTEQLCRKALSTVRNAADRAFRRKRAVGFGKAVDFQITAHNVHSFAADKSEHDFYFGKRRNAFYAVNRDIFPLFDTYWMFYIILHTVWYALSVADMPLFIEFIQKTMF